MAEKIIVEVFGIKDQSSGGSCNCSGGNCCPSITMRKMYDDFVDFLSRSDLRNRIDIKFIDVLRDDMDHYDHVMKAMEKGYGLPLTAINGKLRFYGGLPDRQIYRALMRSR